MLTSLSRDVEAAVIHMAKSLAVEWAPKGIRVNCISYVLPRRYLCCVAF
jgi:hypothetical protein